MRSREMNVGREIYSPLRFAIIVAPFLTKQQKLENRWSNENRRN